MTTKTTLRITASTLNDSLLIRCNLNEASSPVEINYRSEPRSEFVSTQWQCSNVRHSAQELADLGAKLLADACECLIDDLGEVEFERLSK